jgi:hypothetical protein
MPTIVSANRGDTDMAIKLNKYDGKQGVGFFRSMTEAELRDLQYGDTVWFLTCNGAGDARRIKINGRVKLWKRDAERIEIPAKYGMYEYHTFHRGDVHRLLVEIEMNQNLIRAEADGQFLADQGIPVETDA